MGGGGRGEREARAKRWGGEHCPLSSFDLVNLSPVPLASREKSHF